MGAAKRFLARLWSDERGISSVEYALLLSFVAAGVLIGAETLSNAVENEMTDTAALLDGDTGDKNCGPDGGAGEGDGNTCQ